MLVKLKPHELWLTYIILEWGINDCYDWVDIKLIIDHDLTFTDKDLDHRIYIVKTNNNSQLYTADDQWLDWKVYTSPYHTIPTIWITSRPMEANEIPTPIFFQSYNDYINHFEVYTMGERD